MLNEKEINALIVDTYVSMDKTRKMFGKEIYQKRFKPVFEGYLTALCAILETPEDERSVMVKGSK